MAAASPMEENGLAPFEGGSEFASCVKADWNCRLQISAFTLVSVFCLWRSRLKNLCRNSDTLYLIVYLYNILLA